MSINFIKVLATAKLAINNEIQKKRTAALKKIVENNPIILERNKYKAKIQKLKDQIKELEEKRDLIGTSQLKSDDWSDVFYNANFNNECYSLTGSYSNNAPTELMLDIRSHLKDPEFANVIAFNEICGRFDRMMSMACGAQEQRAILLQFYSLDWKGLGIDVPADMDISNIAIKNGRIISDTKALAAPKKK
jgi:hypothetical protein